MSAEVTLVCFAVPQEARPFQKLMRTDARVRVLITGMGAAHAGRAIRAALLDSRPARVFTCGFAGALNPQLKIADVVCALETQVYDARPIKFHCAARVAVTVAEKSALRAQTGADAVEMESAVISRHCRESGVECATLRVISDAADEDLPLDFNQLLNRDEQLSSTRLAWAVVKAPHKIPALIRLGQNSGRAADALAQALVRAI